jgi:hypothetical protein
LPASNTSNILCRINRALVYASRFPVKLIFVVLDLPWLRQMVMKVFRDLPGDEVVVLENWKAFGTLPAPGWWRLV